MLDLLIYCCAGIAAQQFEQSMGPLYAKAARMPQ
jgi:hypothetical protein